MNQVSLIGRITKDPDIKYTSGEKSMAVARFNLAVDRPMKKGEADFISVVCFGKTAEVVEKYAGKGKQLGVVGRIQTGSYEKDGRKVYTTDVIADRVELLGSKSESTATEAKADDIPAGFEKLQGEMDIPF